MTPSQYKNVRKYLQLSQPQFGKLVGASVTTVSKWENKRQKPGTLQMQIYKHLHRCDWSFVELSRVKKYLNNKQNLRGLAYIIFQADYQKGLK